MEQEKPQEPKLAIEMNNIASKQFSISLDEIHDEILIRAKMGHYVLQMTRLSKEQVEALREQGFHIDYEKEHTLISWFNSK